MSGVRRHRAHSEKSPAGAGLQLVRQQRAGLLADPAVGVAIAPLKAKPRLGLQAWQGMGLAGVSLPPTARIPSLKGPSYLAPHAGTVAEVNSDKWPRAL